MSQHIVVNAEETRKWVFGWDQPLMSFFLQVHDLTRDEDDQIVAWHGATSETTMCEVEELVQVASQYGLDIVPSFRIELYGEKDDGR